MSEKFDSSRLHKDPQLEKREKLRGPFKDERNAFAVEVKNESRKRMYRVFDRFQEATSQAAQERLLDQLGRLVKNHLESRELDRMDAGFQMAYEIFAYVNRTSTNEVIRHRATVLFRESEQAVHERFRSDPSQIASYVQQVRSVLKPVENVNQDADRPKTWLTEITRHLDHGELEEKFSIIEGDRATHLEIEVDGELWQIDFKFDAGPYTFLLIHSTADAKLKRYVYAEDLTDMIHRSEIEDYIRNIRAERTQEAAGRELLRGYDIPHGKDKMLYQMFLPEIYDPIVAATLTSLVGMRVLLETKFDATVPEFQFLGHEASGALVQFVQDAKRKGYETVQLDISQHGSEEGFTNFGVPELDNEHLTNPYDLLGDLGNIKDVDINVSTIACHGAGLVPAYEDHGKHQPDHLANISIFTQTKPDVINLVATLDREDSEFSRRNESISSTYYLLAMLEALGQGMTYGEAVDYADQTSQEMSNLNPESVVDGVVIR